MPSSTTPRAVSRILLAPAGAAAGAGGRASGRSWPAGGPSRRMPAAARSSVTGMQRRSWLSRLRQALERDLFVLHFQPIVSLHDGLVSHYEALLRLADERGGALIAPGDFLPAAERHGLIRQIDRMVLEKAAQLLAARARDAGARAERPVRVAINLSALSVTDPGMLGAIERALARHDVDPARLAIEVTETSAISEMGRAKRFCAGVLDLGCSLALDDFGAGFGSFHYLKNLPFSELKIDGEFIRRLPSSRTDQLVVRALAGIVRGMGRHSIAEFVGDRPTMGMLQGYGVDYAQGFEIGRPAAALPERLPDGEPLRL
jgi:EAL domain-containing protein (putative c-di-GMP-specific phosphodiesterase class I)